MSGFDDCVNRALALPLEERAALAQLLLHSLDPEPPDPDWEAAWAEEIKRRSDEVHSGNATLIDWRESIERIRRSLAEMRPQ